MGFLKGHSSTLILAAIAVMVGAVSAETFLNQGSWTFTAPTLLGSAEKPAAVNSTASAFFGANSTATGVSYKLIIKNISNAVVAHIHAGASNATGPVVAFLVQPFSNPLTVDGQVSLSGNLNATNLVGPLAGASISNLTDLFKTGGAYVNVHTVLNPSGEIRATIISS